MSEATQASAYSDFQQLLTNTGVAPNQMWLNLANAVMAAYDAYPCSDPSMSGYNSVQTIWAPETFSDPKNPCYPYIEMGFAATAADNSHSIVALRGTVSAEEAAYDLYGWGTNTACMLPTSNPTTNYGNVKEDLFQFYQGTDYIYTSLAQSFTSAVSAVANALPNTPIYVTSHSLGGALSTLGILDAYAGGNNGSCIMATVTFGSLHVGDQSFVTAYNKAIPITLRCANLSDFVPSLVGLEPGPPPVDPYVHVGLPVTFTWQKWDDWANHSMQDTYLATIQSYFNVLYFGNHQYPY